MPLRAQDFLTCGSDQNCPSQQAVIHICVWQPIGIWLHAYSFISYDVPKDARVYLDLFPTRWYEYEDTTVCSTPAPHDAEVETAYYESTVIAPIATGEASEYLLVAYGDSHGSWPCPPIQRMVYSTQLSEVQVNWAVNEPPTPTITPTPTETPTPTITPTPTPGEIPCIVPEPIVWIDPIVILPGDCYIILPGAEIPLGYLEDIIEATGVVEDFPSIAIFPELEICVDYLQVTGRWFGLDLEVVISTLVNVICIFIIYNMIRAVG